MKNTAENKVVNVEISKGYWNSITIDFEKGNVEVRAFQAPEDMKNYLKYVSTHYYLHDDFIISNKDYLNWDVVSRQNLSYEVLKACKDKVNWEIVLRPQQVNTFKNKVIKLFNSNKSINGYLTGSDVKSIYDRFYFQCEDKSIFAIANNDYSLLKWSNISSDLWLHDNFIREHKDEVDWAIISKYQEFSKEFAKEFKDKIEWGVLSLRPLSEEFIEYNLDELAPLLHNVLMDSQISPQFILKHYNIFKDNISEITLRIHLNPYKTKQEDIYVLMAQDNILHFVSEELLKEVNQNGQACGDNNKLFSKTTDEVLEIGIDDKYKLVVHGDHKYIINQIPNLIDDFNYHTAVHSTWLIVELQKKDITPNETIIYDNPVNFRNEWRDIKYYERLLLSEDFISRNACYLRKDDWKYIIITQKHLSEKFLKDFKDNIDFDLLTYQRKLSEEFIEEFINRFKSSFWAIQTHLSEEFCERHLSRMNWWALVYQTNLSPQFIEKHKNIIDWPAVKAFARDKQFESQRFLENYEYLYEKNFKEKCISQINRLWSAVRGLTS